MGRILIVEDEAPLANVLAGKLTRAGHIVSRAENGQQGYEMAVSMQPDLIVLDILMPRGNGFEMVKMLREDLTLAANIPPIIVLSNLNADQALGELMEMEPAYFLSKTTPLEEVSSKVEEVLHGKTNHLASDLELAT